MNQEAQSLLLELFYFELSDKLWVRCFQLFLESIIIMTFALGLPLLLGLEQGGIITLFLYSASLLVRMQFLIDEHRDNVWGKGWDQGLDNWRAHWIFATSATAMFLGMLLTIQLFYAFLPKATGSQFFGFVLRMNSLQQDLPLVERFGPILSVLGNNILVLMTALILTFLYRSLGMILILSWNAFVWAVVFGVLFRDTASPDSVPGWLFVTYGICGVTPHLLVETLAYIVGSMAALFLSKAVTKYEVSDERFKSSTFSAGQLLLTALLLLSLAAVLESFLPRWLIPT